MLQGPSSDEQAVSGELERARLAALRRYRILDTDPEADFDQLVALASYVCGTPMALVSLIDEDRQWFKARVGLGVRSSEREIAFCDVVVRSGEMLVVPDALADPRFATNPMVLGDPYLRAYAGAPLVTAEGDVLGTLCVLDTVQREFTAEQLGLLSALAHQAMGQLEHRRQADALSTDLARVEVAEQQLAATRRVLDGVLDHTDVLVYAKDLDGRYLMANRAFFRLVGLTGESVLGRTDFDLFPRPAAEKYRANDADVALRGQQRVFEETALYPDGTQQSSLSTKFPLADENGEIYAVAGLSTDVTELMAARQAAAESEQRWRSLVEHSPVSVVVYAADDLCFLFANDAAAAVYGLSSAADLVGRSQLDVVPLEVRPSYRRNLAGILAGHPVVGLESWLRGFDGIVRNIEVNSVAVTYDGRPAVQVVIRDITARVAAETALRTSETRFRTMFTGAPVGVAESLPDGTFVAINPRLCEMLGYAEDELVGQPASVVAAAEERARQALEIAGIADLPGGYAVRRRFLRKDGTTLPVLVSVCVVRDASDQACRLLGMVVDISDQVAAEEGLQDALVQLARQQQFAEAVLENVNAGVLACDADERVVIRNAAQRRLTAFREGEEWAEDRAKRLRILLADGSELPPERSPLRQAIEGADLTDLPLRIGAVNGPLHDVLLTTRRIHAPDGGLLGAVAAFTDITNERAAQAQLLASASFHDAVLAASPDLIFVVDPRTNANVWSSRNLTEMLGYTADDLRDLGEGALAAIVHPEDATRVRAANSAVQDLADGEVLQIRYRARHVSGDYRWLARRVTPFTREDDGTVVQVLGIARDITDIVQVEERLEEAALHDPLTGLPNRTLLADRLRSAMTRSSRTGQELAILFCDLDGFKHVNDTGGHAAGDHVLTVTAERLRACLRAEDSVARVGGDEFVVLVEPVRDQPGSGDVRAEALQIAERIKVTLAEPIPYGDASFVVTASIGLTFADATSEPDEVLRDADIAMYHAKSRGKDRHEVFDGALRADAVERGRVERLLRAAVADARIVSGDVHLPRTRSGGQVPVLSVAYQPIFALDTRDIVGVEALARLSDGQGNAIGPDVFIPLAEETGLIAPLGQHVLDVACADLAGWRADNPDLPGLGVAVNLSARQAGLSHLPELVAAALDRCGLAAELLTLELTESVLLEAGRSTMSALTTLHQSGVRISIDDFGTGFASLRYLAELPVSSGKVDRSFMRGLLDDPTCATIVRAIVGLARDLDLGCIVEGIESDDQLAALPTGVHGQGFLLGRPMDAASITALLAARS